MSTLAQQRRVLAVSAMVTLTIGSITTLSKGDVVNARMIVGIGLAFTICSIMTDLGSPLGAGFAALIMLSAILYQGEDAFKALLKRQQAPRKRRSRARGQRRQRLGNLDDRGDYGGGSGLIPPGVSWTGQANTN